MANLRDTLYFTHDYDSQQDPKIKRMLAKHGAEGYGIFWAVVELLYQQSGYLHLDDCDCIANDMRTDCERIKSVIFDFGLFKRKDKRFWSESVLNRLKIREEKSLKAKNSAQSRWGKRTQSDGNANALRTQSDGNAIKESKIKESINTTAAPNGALYEGKPHKNQTAN